MAKSPISATRDAVPVFCVDCKIIIERRSKLQIRCPGCQRKQRARNTERWRQRSAVEDPAGFAATKKLAQAKLYAKNRERYLAAKRVQVRRPSNVFLHPLICVDCRSEERRLGANQKRCGPCRAKHKQRRIRVYEESNREAIRARQRAKRHSDPGHRLSRNMSRAISHSLGSGKQGSSWRIKVDYTVDQLRAHLERQFDRGMSWENYGDWEVDHIVPVKSFSFQVADDIEFKACWALSNLRPLWRTDNRRKQARRELLI